MNHNSFSVIKAATLRATDGDIGSVQDLFFEDSAWGIRYLVVDTGKWLPGRKVLISPATVKDPDWEAGFLAVNLTRDQVKSSPDINTDQPVSLQMQQELAAHYGWPYLPTYPYWPIGMAYIPPPVSATSNVQVPAPPPAGETQMRSCREILTYSIQGRDGEIGQADDLIVNTKEWQIAFIAVKTGNWFTGRKVLVCAKEVIEISWGDASVSVDLSREQLEGYPEYDGKSSSDEEFEKRLLMYRGKAPFGP